ncbi:MAG: guanylate kinase [Gammaproteobacteria bacterium]|nr:MAG: guanylate kinase [Gammaproteobacteria bacterium]
MTGTLYIVAAPSGAGKSSLVQTLIKTTPNLAASISCTTRPMRHGEQDGVHYHFVSDADFSARLAQGDFLEHAVVFGHRYGTSRSFVEERLLQGLDVILTIDWQGARGVRMAQPDCVSIFILPPSRKALRERLAARGQDSADTIEQRMAAARDEIAHYPEFDYLVLNDDFESALADLQAIIRARRLSRAAQTQKMRALLQDLLA